MYSMHTQDPTSAAAGAAWQVSRGAAAAPLPAAAARTDHGGPAEGTHRLRYHVQLRQRASYAPVLPLQIDAPGVFEACSLLLLSAARAGTLERGRADRPGSIAFSSGLPIARVFEQMLPVVQACNRALRNSPWQFTLHAGE